MRKTGRPDHVRPPLCSTSSSFNVFVYRKIEKILRTPQEIGILVYLDHGPKFGKSVSFR
ncbi:hypothetical protein [Metallosphaera sp.]|uniref:hypothetical protein n=1 Tax=Metallosphaera sp. TaxID=2020860 RepID=UPI00317026AD